MEKLEVTAFVVVGSLLLKSFYRWLHDGVNSFGVTSPPTEQVQHILSFQLDFGLLQLLKEILDSLAATFSTFTIYLHMVSIFFKHVVASADICIAACCR